MEEFTVYIDPTGEIINSGVCPDGMYELQDNPKIRKSSNRQTEYIENKNVKNRPINTTRIDRTSVIADGVDTIEIDNIPDNAILTIIGDGVNINQSVGYFESLTFDLSGEYKIKIESFPYLDYEVTINAT